MQASSAPRSFAASIADSVSAVSPDCETPSASTAVVDDGVAVAVLGAVVDLHRQPRQLLDEELAHQRRVPRGAAGEHVDALDPGQPLGCDAELLELDAAAFEVHAPREGLLDDPRLLVDLLDHEVLVDALLGLSRVPGELADGALHRLSGRGRGSPGRARRCGRCRRSRGRRPAWCRRRAPSGRRRGTARRRRRRARAAVPGGRRRSRGDRCRRPRRRRRGEWRTRSDLAGALAPRGPQRAGPYRCRALARRGWRSPRCRCRSRSSNRPP